MHAIGARALRRIKDRFCIEIGFLRARPADVKSLVGAKSMQRAPVGIRINRNARNPHPPRSGEDAAGDFAPVGDEDFFEHAPGFYRLCGARPTSLTRETSSTRSCRACAAIFHAA